jgi:uncharacterized protein YcbX
MNRFRPNLVVEGFAAYEEDAWGQLRVGDAPTRGGRPCVRCATTLVDQETGRRGAEPLRTLATYRRGGDDGSEVMFGVNVFFEAASVVRVGDAIRA